MNQRSLRILHIATLISPDGAYGGPIRVATNQIKALRDLGHDPLLIAGAYGFEALPESWDGAPVRAFTAHRAVPGSGFAGLAAPSMLRWIRANAYRFDVAHVHLARDLVTLPAALSWLNTGKPLLTQTHGMIMPSSHPLAGVTDGLLTSRAAKSAAVAFTLTEVEEAGLQQLFGNSVRTVRLVNGVPLPPMPEESHQTRDGESLEVLFLARLQRRKRPLDFVAAARELAPLHANARFTLVGPDEGEGAAVRAAIAGLPAEIRGRICWEGSLAPDQTIERIRRADVYVLPSVDEPFPMSVLEAMSVGLPVVVSNTCGLAAAIAQANAGTVIAPNVENLSRAIARTISEHTLRRVQGANARQLVESSYSMSAVAAVLEERYQGAIQRNREGAV